MRHFLLGFGTVAALFLTTSFVRKHVASVEPAYALPGAAVLAPLRKGVDIVGPAKIVARIPALSEAQARYAASYLSQQSRIAVVRWCRSSDTCEEASR